MASAISSGRFMGALGASILNATRGRYYVGNGEAVERQPLATDPIGNFSLTLNNVVVGSAIQVEDQLGTTTFYSATAAATTVVIPLYAYAAGSSNNNLRVKVRKGTSSPFYKPFETLTTALVGSQSVYVSQISDE